MISIKNGERKIQRDEKAMLPNFLIIGAPRSGTTSLFHNLAQHPQVCTSQKAEVRFFDINYDKGVSWYQKFFSHCNSSYKAIGEKSASYLVYPEVAYRIKETLGDVKLIVILRNPVDRLLSHYKNGVRLGNIPINTSFRENLKQNQSLLEMGLYYNHLKQYLDYFELKDIYIGFFEDFTNYPNSFYKAIFGFLDLDEKFIPQNKVYNKSNIYRISKRNLKNREISILKRLPFSNKLLSSLKYNLTFTEEELEFLKNYYKESNKKLFKLLNINNKWD